MHEFDEDTEIEEIKPGVYDGRITARWNIGPYANGGYVLAVAMAALRKALPSPDPLSVTAHYLRPCEPGPVTVQVEAIKVGRKYSTGMARVVLGEREHVRILATYGDLSSNDGPTHLTGTPPPLPPWSALPAAEPSDIAECTRRFEIRSATPSLLTLPESRPDKSAAQPEVSGWVRFADGRRPDVHTLGLIADAFPPAAAQVLEPGWFPTLELTVHVRARPTSEWLRCVFRTRFIYRGLLEEDGEIWDETGTLVALSRQLAGVPRSAT